MRRSSLSKQIVQTVATISAEALEKQEVRQLLQVSNVQEIIWRLREEGDTAAADILYQFIVKQLQHSKVTAIEEIHRGSSKPELVELESGLRAIFKSDEVSVDVEREILLHKIDYEIGINIVPITVARTIDGRSGSLQLFIENSLAADEVATAKLKAIGFEGKSAELGIHSLYSALQPEQSPAAKTLQLLTVEGDSDNAGNYLLPKVGRQVAIDGSYAFDVAEYIAEAHITELQSNVGAFLLDERIAAKLEAILTDETHPIMQAIRKLDLFAEEGVDYDDFIDYHSVELNMRLVLAAYTNALTRQRRFNLSANGKQAHLLELLSAREWHAADDMILKDTDLRIAFNHFAPDLQELAMRKRDHELLKWLHTNAPSESLNLSKYEAVNYAIHSGDSVFVAKLKALGFEAEAPDRIEARQVSALHAFNFGELKIATRLMDKLVTDSKASNAEFMFSLLSTDNLSSDQRKLRWLFKYEDFFKSQLANHDQLVLLLAANIRHYAVELSSSSDLTMQPILEMIAFLARVCACQKNLGTRITTAFGKLKSTLLLGRVAISIASF